ncbi:hypothetical protein BGX38DRAFT_1169358, partial [Terfezia claveryi]
GPAFNCDYHASKFHPTIWFITYPTLPFFLAHSSPLIPLASRPSTSLKFINLTFLPSILTPLSFGSFQKSIVTLHDTASHDPGTASLGGGLSIHCSSTPSIVTLPPYCAIASSSSRLSFGEILFSINPSSLNPPQTTGRFPSLSSIVINSSHVKGLAIN